MNSPRYDNELTLNVGEAIWSRINNDNLLSYIRFPTDYDDGTYDDGTKVLSTNVSNANQFRTPDSWSEEPINRCYEWKKRGLQTLVEVSPLEGATP